MRSVSAPRFSDLPFLIVGLSLGFQALIKRLRLQAGVHEEIAIGMGSIFFALCESEGCIMKELGERLQMPKGTLSGLVRRMEQLGLVERWPCPEDGRAQRVALTRKGRGMEASLRARHARAMRILQAGLSAEEIAELQRLLGRVLENMRFNERVERRAPAAAG